MRRNNQIISIIIPTKNEARRLALLLPSLGSQTYKHFEVIINDDNQTTDNTKEVIKKSSAKIKIRHIFKNKSMAQSRIAAAKIAKGNYLLHLDADMILPPIVLQACMAQAKKGYDALILPEVSVGHGYWSQVRAFEKSLYVGDETIESARFFSKKAYWMAEGHNERMVLSEDKDLDLRVRTAGFKVGRIDEVIYHNEDYDLRRSILKKFFYGKTASLFIFTHPKQAFIQGNLLFRPTYFRNWNKLVASPMMAASMFLAKFLEGLFGLAGLLFGRYFPSIDPWKKS